MRITSNIRRNLISAGLASGGFSTIILSFYYLIFVVFRLRGKLPLNEGTYVPVVPQWAGSWGFFFAAWFLMMASALFVVLMFVGLKRNTYALSMLNKFTTQLLAEPKYQYALIFGLFCCAAVLAIVTGFRHDYVAFTLQWGAILQGKDPWDLDDSIPVNAYGPLFNTIAFIFAIHPLAPKLLFNLAWFGSATYLAKVLLRHYQLSSLTALAVVFSLFLNPFFWLTIAEYGLFDILPAISCLSALVFIYRRRFYWAGLLLGLGVLLKIYPIVLLPFLMIDGRRLNIAPALSCIGTVAMGLLISVGIWGQSTFSPFLFAQARDSKILSIFRFLRGKASPLRLFVDQPNWDAYSVYAIALFVGAVLLLVWVKNLETSLAATVGIVTTLTFYKVGHSQFYTCIFLMMPYWYATSPLPEFRKLKILLPFSLLLAWIAVLQVAYNLFGGMLSHPWFHLREIVGLPTFALACWSVVAALSLGGRSLGSQHPRA